MNRLNRDSLTPEERRSWEALRGGPVTVLQIGEGNFLRGFADWMLHRCRETGLFQGSVAVTQPRPSGKAKIHALAEQDGLYTLLTRGIEEGRPVERKEIVPIFSEAFDPYEEWSRLEALAERPELRFVLSNTTEAGLAYRPEALAEGKPIASFPGKIAWLLFKRYSALGGEAAPGLVFLPCELLDRNGDELKRCVLRYCEDWGLPEPFRRWAAERNRFLNSLVDRIVTGYPAGEADALFAEWGYADEMLNTAEPYHFWAIEAEPDLGGELPLGKAGLNVVWTDDLRPYQLRKVRILNGAHSLMAPLALLNGLQYVGETIDHPEWGRFAREAVEREIIPAVPLPEAELKAYADTVYERFRNPYIRHRLADIAMNGISKFRTRLLPSLLHYAERSEALPDRLVRALAGLLRYSRATRTSEGFVGRTLAGTEYLLRDDAELLGAMADIWAANPSPEQAAERLLGLRAAWGADLTSIEGLAARTASALRELEGSGHE